MTMTEFVQDVLASFDRLSRAEQAIVVREIAKRVKHGQDENEGGPLAEDELTFLTDQMFQMYDREEERNGSA
ncbi:MAG: hypothetical protein WD063_15385 [Pirellulales bacterium]